MFRLLFFSLLILYPVRMFPQPDETSDTLRFVLENHQYHEALVILENEPPDRENLLLKADCYEKLYDYASALDVYKRLLEEYPDDADLVISLAECASQAGDSGLSLQGWVLADSLSPDNLFIQTQKAMALYKNQNWTEAIAQAKTVFATDTVPLLLRITGDAFLYSSEGDSAVWYYSKAIGINPADYLAVNKLGSIYLGAKFFDAAIDLTKTYLENINPNQQLIGQLNGRAHYLAGNHEEATLRLKENVALGDSSYTTCYYLGMSLYARKLYFEAVPWLKRAYMLNSADVILLYYYGTALSRTYDRKRGIEVLNEGVAKIEEMSAMLYDFDRSLADAFQRSGNYTEAIEYFKSAYLRNSENNSLLYTIAYCFELLGDFDNAVDYYRRFLKTAPDNLKIDEDDWKEETDIEKINPSEVLYRNAYRRIEKLMEE